MTALPRLGPVQQDALREMANIGSGHAATALSQLTGLQVMITVPDVAFRRSDEIAATVAAPGDRVVMLAMRMLGGLTGETVFLMQERRAGLFANILLGRSGLERPDTLGQLELSSLMETGNIMAGSFMNALSECMGKMLLPSVPSIAISSLGEIMSSRVGTDPDRSLLVVETSFTFGQSLEGEELRGVFLFVLEDEEALNEVVRSVGLPI